MFFDFTRNAVLNSVALIATTTVLLKAFSPTASSEASHITSYGKELVVSNPTPKLSASLPLFMDFDGDGIPDDIDQDDDNDGITDFEELGSVNPDPLNCNGASLSFSTFVEETGNGDAIFDTFEVYRFLNVAPAPENIDALITITSQNNAIINNLDDATTGFPGAFQPNINFEGVGTPSVGFKISFVDGGTNNARMIENFGGIVNDVDGNSLVREAYIVKSPNSYVVDNPTNIEVVDLPGGFVQYRAKGTVEQPNIGTNPVFQGYWQNNNVQEVDFVFQLIKNTADAFDRQFSMFVSECSVSSFNDPVFTLDPSFAPDTDEDGVPDYQDLDSDNDGIYDVVEAGHGLANSDGMLSGPVGSDGIADSAQNPGEDGTGTTNISERDSDNDGNPDRIEADSDNDGCNDTLEAGFIDALLSGTTDGKLGTQTPETVDPTNGTVTSGEFGQGYTMPLDTDNNGILDFQEVGPDGDQNSIPNGCQDTDHDGLVDISDLDDDNDGIPDTVEVAGLAPYGDHDSDGIYDFLDPDFPNFLDSNGDGVSDQFDIDLDGIVNQLDLDSDNDGLSDNVEAQTTAGYIPPSSIIDGNGIPSNYGGGLVPIDTDFDTIPDYLDMNSDNEGDDDATESGIVVSLLDVDNDGLSNTVDNTIGYLDVNGTIDNPAQLPDLQSPGGDVDFRDGNTIPIANNDNLIVAEDSATGSANQVTVSANDEIGNNGGDGDDFELTTAPTNGNVTEINDGTFEYIPDLDYRGTDSFTYTITDVDGDMATATVDITVNPGDNNPIANDDVLLVEEDSQAGTANQVSIGDNDTLGTDGGDGDEYSMLIPPDNGVVTEISDGVFQYIPQPNFNGTDSFTYLITDADGDIATAVVAISVSPVDDIPTAVDDILEIIQGVTDGAVAEIDVSTNDSVGGDGSDGDDYTMTSPPSNGTVTEVEDGVFQYTPNPGFNGIDSFIYALEDADASLATAVVTITVVSTDPDQDGVFGTLDLDDDNDGIPDIIEQNGNPHRDTDGDGIIDSLDLDSDGDGIPDYIESGSNAIDADGDDRIDGPYGTDGIPDAVQKAPDSGEISYPLLDYDGDSINDFQDIDDDNDGVPTFYEDINSDGNPMNDDSDGDGIADYRDLDDDGDGVHTLDEDINLDGDPRNDDTDSDGVPDYLDIDDDGDSIPTLFENPNQDGDNDPSTGNTQDSDGDGIPDYLDDDDDNDGLLTIDEDVDEDGDPRNDDTDGDGLPNYLDADDDNDGAPTSEELGDFDGDGIPDYLEVNNYNANAEDGVEIFNGLSPNGDGDHDVFVIEGLERLKDNTLKIFNRWGVLVYEADSYGSNGNYFTGESNGRGSISRGEQLPEGTYYYVLIYKNDKDVPKKRADFLYINR